MAVEHRIADIHMHVIPGVDDGAYDMEMSLEMIRQAVSQGVRTIFCTSHDFAWRDDGVEAGFRFKALQRNCAELVPEVKLYKGCELYCDQFSTSTILRGLRDGIYPTMNNGKYVLIEFPTWGFFYGSIREICARFLEEGWRPILAHTERFHRVMGTIDNVAELKKDGCLVQVNAYSIADESSEITRKWANELLERQLIDFIGSDAHRTDHRPPKYTNGLNRIYEMCSEDYADAICFGNAERLLIGGAK